MSPYDELLELVLIEELEIVLELELESLLLEEDVTVLEEL